MDLRDIRRGGMDCIHLAEDTGQWRAIVNKTMNYYGFK
jgi:trehalose/maltose hydrolase-like predicted phosphorylase